MDSVGVGAFANIAFRYTLSVHEGKSEELVQVQVFDENSSVDSKSDTDTSLADSDLEEETWERWISFDTANWERGEYTAEILVRDEITGKNSEQSDVEFELVDPLQEGEVDLESIEKPATIRKGEPFSFKLHLRNRSDRDSSIVSIPSYRYEDGDWQSGDSEDKIRVNIPARTTRTWESAEFSLDYSGTHEFRLPDLGVSWTLTVK